MKQLHFLGLKNFDSRAAYYSHHENESTTGGHLCAARYYRNHLEHQVPVDGHLMKSIHITETALEHSHPGFLSVPCGHGLISSTTSTWIHHLVLCLLLYLLCREIQLQ